MTKGNFNKIWRLVYDDPDPDPNGGAKATLTDFLKTNPGAQDELNKIVADNRRKLTQQNQDLVKQLEELKEQTNLTAQQKEELESRINTLQEQYMTKEEIAKKEAAKQAKLFDEQQKKTQQELDSWRTRYSEATIKRSIMDAAVEGKAWNPEQIVAILSTNSYLGQVVGDDGKPTGELTPIVKFQDISSDGKPVTLELNPQQVIKRMKELPDKYGNLFKTDAAGGLFSNSGSNSAVSTGDLKDLGKYAEWRKKHPDLDVSKLKK